MPPSRNILEALFDVRPITKSGVLDLEKISRVKPEIDLRKRNKTPAEPEILPVVAELTVAETQSVPDKLESIPSKKGFFREFERVIAEPVNITAELIRFGGRVVPFEAKRRENKVPKVENFWNKTSPAPEPAIQPTAETITCVKNRFHSPGERELEAWIDLYRKNKGTPVPERHGTIQKFVHPGHTAKKHPWINKFKIFMILFAIGIPVLLVFGYRGSVSLKNDILKNGGDAVAKLEAAKENLVDFNFLSAADNFALAYDDFGRASENLNSLGANFLSSFSGVPGLDRVKSASNLVKAGQNISKAGENLALAFNTLSRTNFLAKTSLAKTVSEFKNVLVYADLNVADAGRLVADIDPATLPEEKRQLFIDFKEKIPEFQKYIGDAVDYSDFLLGVVGEKSPKKYLVLLQNNSELRATGGFPGTYALVSFEGGFLKDVKVDDIYNPDGQLKENIIPPIPLQHITPNWGMRDANWFADFPASAKKVEEFYKKDLLAGEAGGGGTVDGVLSLTPEVIERILEIVGPIDMPEYNLKIDSKNFLSEIQEEVEYGANRVQPKTIVKELQPKLFAKLAEQDGSKWLEIFKVLTQSAEEKQILAFFNDAKLQKVAVNNDIAGQVKNTPGDYLQIVFSNVKGSKTDAVTANSFNLNTEIKGDSVSHKLTITRSHNGGNSSFGFYNKTNPSYVRVYVSEGSVMDSIRGNTLTDYQTIIGHEDFNFKKDPDLAESEADVSHPFKGVDVFREGDKTVFGFWLVLKPKETRSVIIEFTSAVLAEGGYSLLWQKQSGTDRDPISFTLTLSEGVKIAGLPEGSNLNSGTIELKSDLSIDREVNLKFD